MSEATAEERRAASWALYLEHPEVFHAALRTTGPWGIIEGTDLIHDFLLDRLPHALVSYDPRRGPIEPWLFAVFRRYARTSLAAIAKRTMVSSMMLEEAQPSSPAALLPISEEQTRAVLNALSDLPESLGTLLNAYFGSGPESGNVRALSRRFSMSRYGIDQQLRLALGAVATQIEGSGILSGEELRACQEYLVLGTQANEIARHFGQSVDEARLLLRNSVHVLVDVVARAITMNHLEDDAMTNTGQPEYRDLVDAIKRDDCDKVESLRDRWSTIASYVEKNPTAADDVDLTPEQRATLILWLSTPPQPQPTPWSELRGREFIVDVRKAQIDFIAHLWSAWANRKIVDQLSEVLASFQDRDAWLSRSRLCFERLAPQLSGKLFAEVVDGVPKPLLEAVAGYAAFVDQQLVAQTNYPSEAWLGINVSEEPFVLSSPESRTLSDRDLGNAVAFHSDIGPQLGCGLAQAITWSLPVHGDILPNVQVVLNETSCRLASTAENPFAALSRERQWSR